MKHFSFDVFTERQRQILPKLVRPEKLAAHETGMSQSNFKRLKNEIIKKTKTSNLASAIAVLAMNGVEFEIMEA